MDRRGLSPVAEGPRQVILIHCTNCGTAYPDSGMPYCCAICGGVYDLSELPQYNPSASANFPGIWRYRSTFGFTDDGPVVTLGEGRTPLVEDGAFGLKIFNKLEYQNPTGSCHDRAAAVLVNHLTRRGIQQIVLDTAGNAGASMAAYAARAGIHTRIFAPAASDPVKRERVARYGAELILVRGGPEEAEQAARSAIREDCPLASLAYQPISMAGAATIAFELYEGLGRAPASVVIPVGHGNLMLGVMRGFHSLVECGLIPSLPKFVGVQPRSFAPVWHRFHSNQTVMVEPSGPTDSMRVSDPVHGERLIHALRQAGGEMLAVDDAEIGPSRDQLARRGYYVELTSAMGWAALRNAAEWLESPVVLVLTGTAFKPGA